MRGRMLWFNLDKGYGYIHTEHDERLHVAREGFRAGRALTKAGVALSVDAIPARRQPDRRMLPYRRQPSDLGINIPLLPSLATRASALGLGLGDRFGDFQGCSESSEEMVLQAEKPG